MLTQLWADLDHPEGKFLCNLHLLVAALVISLTLVASEGSVPLISAFVVGVVTPTYNPLSGRHDYLVSDGEEAQDVQKCGFDQIEAHRLALHLGHPGCVESMQRRRPKGLIGQSWEWEKRGHSGCLAK